MITRREILKGSFCLLAAPELCWRAANAQDRVPAQGYQSVPQTMLEQRGIAPVFLPYSRFYENEEQETKGRFLDFGVSEAQFDQMTDDVWLKICEQKYQPYPNISVDQIAEFVKEVVGRTEKLGEQHFKVSLNDLGHQWLTAEAACAWCVTSIKVDDYLLAAPSRGEEIETAKSQLPAVVLKNTPPRAVCSGYSLVLRDVARKAGLTAHILQGKVRLPVSGGTGGHCWTVFHFPGDLNVPADTSRPAESKDVLRYGGKIRRFTNLPRRREEWELYHATYFNWTPIPKNIIARDDPRESVVLLDMTEEQWLSFDTYGEYGKIYLPLRDKLLRR